MTCTSPRCPPRVPAFPTPRRVMYWPLATPGGIWTLIVLSPRVRPSPRHFLQGDSTICPSPLHVGHGATLTNCPKNDRWARRTSPEPPHVGQTRGLEPGSAPFPLQRSHGSRSLRVRLFSTPLATSPSVSETVTLTSAPVRTLPPRRAAPNISSSPAEAPKSR